VTQRHYRLGRRQVTVDRTRSAILAAARQLVSEAGPAPGMGSVARRAGVSRITVYNQFGSKERLLQALEREVAPDAEEPSADPAADPRDQLRLRIARACAAWAADPALHRQLQARGRAPEESRRDRELAELLAGRDQLRPGCSIKEAEDVIGLLASFAAFDRLRGSGRRSPGAVAEILLRLAQAILAPIVAAYA
jgi:AcrR family transcriptional regulator